MKIKCDFSIEATTILNDFFQSLLVITNSSLFQQIIKHPTYITFSYFFGQTDMSDDEYMSLSMMIFLVETNFETKFCLVEQFTYDFFQIEQIDKYSSAFPILIFINHYEIKNVGVLFDSLSELSVSINIILDYVLVSF